MKGLFVKAVSVLALFVSQVLIARSLSVSNFGVYNFLWSIITIFSFVVMWGGEREIVKFTAQQFPKGNISRIRNNIIGSYVIIFFHWVLCSFILYQIVDKKYDNLSFYHIAAVLAALLFASLSRISYSLTRGLGKVFYAELSYNVVRPLFVLVILAIIYLFGYELTGTLLFTLLVLSFLIAWCCTGVLNYRKVPPDSVTIHNLWPLYRYRFGFFLLAVGVPLLSNMNLVLLGVISDDTSVALYASAARLVNLVLIGAVSINLLITPKIAELYTSGKMKQLFSLLRSNNKYALMISIIPVVCLYCWGDVLLSIFGQQYGGAYGILLVLVTGQTINLACGPVNIFCAMSGYQVVAAVVTFTCCTLQAILCYLFIPRYGVIAAAYANLLSMVLVNFTLAYYIFKKTGINLTFFNLIMFKGDEG